MSPDRDNPTTRPAAMRPMAVVSHIAVLSNASATAAGRAPCAAPRLQPGDQIAGRERQRHHEPRREVAVVHVRPERRGRSSRERPVEQARRGQVLRHADGGQQRDPGPRSSGRTGARLRARRPSARSGTAAAWPRPARAIPCRRPDRSRAAARPQPKPRCRRAGASGR